MQPLQQSWVQSQHHPIQWKADEAVWNEVVKKQDKNPAGKIIKFKYLSNDAHPIVLML
jgi:hypothetical protein